jgi:hypothetical protein
MTWAASNAAEMFQRCAARASGALNCAGTNEGIARAVSPSPPPKPTDDVPALSVKP